MQVGIDVKCMYTNFGGRDLTPNLAGVTCLISEILLLSKTAKFLFRPMDYPWSSKNLIA